MVTKEQAEIIREYYPKMKPQEVADMVGMKKVNLVAYAYRNCISNNYYWTKEEEDYLLNWYGKMSAKAISKKLGRSYRAVIDKLNKLQVGNFIENSADMTLAEVCRLVSRDKETVKKTWVKYGLKIRKKGKYSMIRESDLLEFMKNNPDRWDATKCEKWFFEKYDWFREKHEKDLERMCAKRWAKVGKDYLSNT